MRTFITSLALGAACLWADTIGGEIVAGVYSHTPSGGAAYALPFHEPVTYDLKDDLGWDRETDVYLSLSLEHPMPVLPNLKVTASPLYYSGTSDVTSFVWGQIDLPKGRIASELRLNMFDATGYYELVDKEIEVDVGLTLRYLNGDATVKTLATFEGIELNVLRERIDIDEYIPMAYAHMAMHIPGTQLSLQATTNFIRYEETTHYDVDLALRFTPLLGLGVQGGFRYIKLRTPNDLIDDLYLDVAVSGVYVAVVWDF